ncbi:hypothetical protein [Rhodococcus sp. IEGM 1408]|nr:hypothetical protein [Rhodococcus sp. IEGM 1408]MDV8003170.1 hypothetical protein [Rhodococcus sp. IEGM 1408]
MTDPETPEQDEPTGPAGWHARRFGKPTPTTETPTDPASWHAHLYRKAAR